MSKFSSLKRAHDYDVKEWLIKSLDLSPYQKNKLYQEEIVRWAPFYFYKRYEAKAAWWWRLTLLIWPIYWIIAIIVILLKWIITGNKGLGRKWIDKVHRPWADRLGL